uniref:Putative secreted protein ovary overexpressed n=1 Tax=Rhipicephalus microplus TaxID=6941 RepID=A0A6M2DBD4_RHIMP
MTASASVVFWPFFSIEFSCILVGVVAGASTGTVLHSVACHAKLCNPEVRQLHDSQVNVHSPSGLSSCQQPQFGHPRMLYHFFYY